MELFFADVEIMLRQHGSKQNKAACFVELGSEHRGVFRRRNPPGSWQVDMCGTAPVEHRGGCVDSLIRLCAARTTDSLDVAFEVCDAVAARTSGANQGHRISPSTPAGRLCSTKQMMSSASHLNEQKCATGSAKSISWNDANTSCSAGCEAEPRNHPRRRCTQNRSGSRQQVCDASRFRGADRRLEGSVQGVQAARMVLGRG